MEELFPKSEYQLLCERIEGKDEDYARQECRNYFDSLVERLRSHISVSEWGHARSVALDVCEANIKAMFKEFPRNRLNECISDLCHRVSSAIQAGVTYILPAKPLKYLVTYGEWESIYKAIQLADARVLDELADKYGGAAND